MDAPDYAYYVSVGGKLPEETFDEWITRAKAHVDWLIGWKEPTERQADAYKTAICLAVDQFAEYGGPASGGFAIGSFRMSDDGGKVSGYSMATDAAWEVLAPTGLLWSGVC